MQVETLAGGVVVVVFFSPGRLGFGFGFSLPPSRRPLFRLLLLACTLTSPAPRANGLWHPLGPPSREGIGPLSLLPGVWQRDPSAEGSPSEGHGAGSARCRLPAAPEAESGAAAGVGGWPTAPSPAAGRSLFNNLEGIECKQAGFLYFFFFLNSFVPFCEVGRMRSASRSSCSQAPLGRSPV